MNNMKKYNEENDCKNRINGVLKELLFSFIYIICFLAIMGVAALLIKFIQLQLIKYSLIDLDITKGIISFIILICIMIIAIWCVTTTYDFTIFFMRCARGFTIIFLLICIMLIMFSNYKLKDIKSLDLILILATISSSFFYLFKNIKSLKFKNRRRNFQEIYGILYAIVLGSASIVLLIINVDSIANGNVSNYIRIDYYKNILAVIWLIDIIRNFCTSLINTGNKDK